MFYVRDHEACWRFLEFPIQANYFNVQKLAVHLPGHRNTYIQEDANIAAIVKQEHAGTTSTASFKINANDRNTCKMLYQDFTKEYIFDYKRYEKRKNKWLAIRRVNAVSPKYVETFALKLLLVSASGPKSFTDFRIAYGNAYENIQRNSYS